ncbi:MULTISPECIES: J domain-containing protein [Natrialbaceae]|uniref:J domain-containing protein n=1 Tax=Natrialbaceae TaxID=1644061 RepID=UPI00207D2156|nr:J domain-containing protein [Natronococcus sp. CG52]
MSNPYEILGVSEGASDEVIDAAYTALVKKHHPDQGGDGEEFDRIKTAYTEITSDSPDTELSVSAPHESVSCPIDAYSVRTQLDSGITIEGDTLSVTLLNLFKSDVSEISMSETTNERFVAIFEIENCSDTLQRWDPLDEMKIIDEEGFTYNSNPQEQASIYRDKLPPRLTTANVELEAASKTHSILILPEFPDNIIPEKIIYTHYIFQGGSTSGRVQGKNRFEFELAEADWHELLPIEA